MAARMASRLAPCSRPKWIDPPNCGDDARHRHSNIGSAIRCHGAVAAACSDEVDPGQFELVCAGNREAVLELAAIWTVNAVSLIGSETNGRNSRLVMRLVVRADQYVRWKVSESSGGLLPYGSVLIPDASLFTPLSRPGG